MPDRKQSLLDAHAGDEPIQLSRLRTIPQLAATSGGLFSEASLRWHIFNAEQNGLSSAIVRIGRRVYIDLDRFERWIGAQRAA